MKEGKSFGLPIISCKLKECNKNEVGIYNLNVLMLHTSMSLFILM